LVFFKALTATFSEILAGNTSANTNPFPEILVFLACATGENYLFLEIIFLINYQQIIVVDTRNAGELPL
jgi:hypothetical protein